MTAKGFQYYSAREKAGVGLLVPAKQLGGLILLKELAPHYTTEQVEPYSWLFQFPFNTAKVNRHARPGLYL